MNLRFQDACGQCYDGYLTITGIKNGVATKIRKLNEKCLMHCTHNLAVGDTIKSNPLLKHF